MLDRSIVISLRRKKPSESVERLRPRKLMAETEPLRAELALWAEQHIEELREIDPEFLPGLDDRAFESWEPLLSIAMLAEFEGAAGWVENARQAALILAGERPADTDGDRVAALVAIRALFDADGIEALSSASIVAALNESEELPFGGYRKGAGIDARGLARLLRPFGIAPHNVRASGERWKGYRREAFLDSWSRYTEPADLPRAGAHTFASKDRDSDPYHRTDPSNHGGSWGFSDPYQGAVGTDAENPESADEHRERYAGTDETGEPGPEARSRVVSALTQEQRVEHWRSRREQHRAELEAGGRTLAETTDAELLDVFADSFGAVEITSQPDPEARRPANERTADDLARAREDVRRASALDRQGQVDREELERRARALAEHRARAFEPEPSREQQTARALRFALAWARRDSEEPHPLAERQQTDLELAAEIIAASLTGAPHVIGRWWSSKPIREGLAHAGVTDEATIQAALELLGTQVRNRGTTSSRWRLDHVPELPRLSGEQVAECRCEPPRREWRLAIGGPWTCLQCHPPASGRAVEYRGRTEDQP